MAFLEGPSVKQEEIIKQELGEGPDDLEQGVRNLRNMLAATPYLPQPDQIDKRQLEIFVQGCRMDLERARSKLEAYCVARVRYKDLFAYHSLSVPPLNDVTNFIDVVTLPKLTDEGYRVTIFRIKARYPDSAADISAAVRAILLLSDVRLRDETLIAGDVFIYEISNCRASLTARVAAAIPTVKRGIHLAHSAYPQRLKRLHVVGAPPFFASSIQLLRNCLSEKIKQRYYIHPKVEDLLDHIPARVLPAEWGGKEESIDIIAKKWRLRIDESGDYLRRLNEICDIIPESQKDTDIYGTVGAFRKLDID